MIADREMSPQQQRELVTELRRDAIREVYEAQSGHPGSAMSTMDMLVALYFGGVLKYDPNNPGWEDRDYFLLSNGHACPALYAVLSKAGFFEQEELWKFRELEAGTQGHPHRGALPGVEISSGSLGMGLSVGIGLAVALKKQERSNRVFVMMSDGEQEEGSTWEAVMYAGSLGSGDAELSGMSGLDNLVAIVDKNQFQIDAATKKIQPSLDPLPEKYESFGWQVWDIDGHDGEQIMHALNEAQNASRPAAIIANTVRGKGVSFMEGSPDWHSGKLSEEQYEQALQDLQS